MRREEQAGIYGTNQEVKQIAELVKEKGPKGMRRSELKKELEVGKDKLIRLLAQADALGLVQVSNSRQGGDGRIYFTDHKDLYESWNDDSKEKLVKEIENTLEQLQPSENHGVRVNVQLVDER